MVKQYTEKYIEQLLHDNEELKSRLFESEEALNAIRNGEVDAIVVSGKEGEKIFSLTSSETPYRVLLEEMNEGAITLSSNGLILYCNKRFSEMLSLPVTAIVGNDFTIFITEADKKNALIFLKREHTERQRELLHADVVKVQCLCNYNFH